MKPKTGRVCRAGAWLGMAWLGLLPICPLAAQEPKPRTTLLIPRQPRFNLQVYSVAFSPDGKTLVSGSGDGAVRLWDVATGEERATFKGHLLVTCVAFSPDGKTIASGSREGTIRLWD